MRGCVVRASTAKEALKLAAAHDSSNEKAWLNPNLTSCEQVKTTGTAEVGC
jgi:hypothetical protein